MNLQWNPDTTKSKGLGKCVRYNGSSLYLGCFLFSVFFLLLLLLLLLLFFFLILFSLYLPFFFLFSFFSWLKNIVRYTGVFVILWLVVSGFL